MHKRQHSGERPFMCDWEDCGKMFTTGYGLKSHYRTHTNERPYKCNFDNCGKAFKTSGDLQKHIRTHTGMTSDIYLVYLRIVFAELYI